MADAIRPCPDRDVEELLEVINDAAQTEARAIPVQDLQIGCA
jgi:hypothetical protein